MYQSNTLFCFLLKKKKKKYLKKEALSTQDYTLVLNKENTLFPWFSFCVMSADNACNSHFYLFNDTNKQYST